MRAVRLTGWQRPPELCEIPEPVAAPGGVVLRVAGAGLCHSDLHLMHWPAGTLPYELPFTLGHEVTGTVAELGPGANGVDVGDEVIVYGPWGCGACRRCSAGEEHLCERRSLQRGCGLGRDGGLAEYLAVPSPRLLVALGGLDPIAAAPLADAALTPYHAIRRALPYLHPGASAVVIGVGGLGHVAVQLLAALSSARIVAVDVRPEALELARAAGAHEAVLADEAEPRGAAVVLDCVGSDATLALAAAAVAPGGHLSIIGMAGGTLPLRRGAVPMEATVVMSNWGTRAELAEVVALAREGIIRLAVETVPLEAVPAAYERLDRGEVRGRVVALPNGGEAA
jgi:propanol-preferring alcohol dehydrogenase